MLPAGEGFGWQGEARDAGQAVCLCSDGHCCWKETGGKFQSTVSDCTTDFPDLTLPSIMFFKHGIGIGLHILLGGSVKCHGFCIRLRLTKWDHKLYVVQRQWQHHNHTITASDFTGLVFRCPLMLHIVANTLHNQSQETHVAFTFSMINKKVMRVNMQGLHWYQPRLQFLRSHTQDTRQTRANMVQKAEGTLAQK